MGEQFPPVKINFAAVQVVGWPGLSLVAIAFAIAFEFPQTRWLLLLGLAAGFVCAAVLISRRRGRQHSEPLVEIGHPDRDRQE